MASTATEVTPVTARISFVESVPDGQKAYHLMYADDANLARTNVQQEWHSTTFADIRGQESTLSFARSGVAIRVFNSAMAYQDFEDDSKVRAVYLKELENYLQDFLGASEVRVFRYGIRKRHPEFPVSTGTQYEFQQPTTIAHIDATPDSTREEMLKQFGNRATELMTKRYQWVNVWKPLRGPVKDWPLCFCDASTVKSTDLEITDMVYEDYHTENVSLRGNCTQRWYYLSEQTSNEIIIFVQCDSDATAIGGVPHCSFAHPAADPAGPPRESIEARALVVYHDSPLNHQHG